MKIITSLALVAAALTFANTGSASDYTTTQEVLPGQGIVSVLTLPAGHTRFDISQNMSTHGLTPFTCSIVELVVSDIGKDDNTAPRAYVLASTHIGARNMSFVCSVDVKLDKPATVLFLVSNDDKEFRETHVYYIRGMH